MKTVRIFTTDYCPYCIRVKMLFSQKGVPFEEHNLSDDPDRLSELCRQTGFKTVPQVFIGEQFFGGCDDIATLESKGELDALLSD